MVYDKNSHSLHKICSRICSFPSSLPMRFIEEFSQPGDLILDNFSGKGSVPLEACLNGRIGVGNDISPEAYVLTHAKVRPIDLRHVHKFLAELKREINKIKKIDIENNLDRNARIFYSKKTFDQILKIRKILLNKKTDVAIFTKALICGILHGNSKVSLSLRCSHSFSMSPNYVKEYAKKHKLRRPYRDMIECLKIKAEEVLKDGIPKIKGKVYAKDARKLPLEDETVSLIITSPPYFNLNTYAWDNWLRLWFLGYNYKEIKKKLFETGSKEKYRNFMKESMKEMYRLLKSNSFCFIVVGDVKLNGETINTAKFLSEPAREIGFEVDKIITDIIPIHRKQFTYLNKNDGIKIDRILCLKKN